MSESKPPEASGNRQKRGRRGARYAVVPQAIPQVHEAPASATGAEWPRIVSATQAARGFSDLISRVRYKGETYVIERGGQAMCELRPVTTRGITGAELLALVKTLPRPADEFLAAVDTITRHQATIEPSAWEK
jgi:hypothetical protein